MKKSFKKFLSLIITAAIAFSLVPAFAFTVSAKASDHVRITKLDSYNENGYYWMPFKIENLNNPNNYPDGYLGGSLEIWAELINSSGKRVFTWTYGTGKKLDMFFIDPGKTKNKREFGIKLSDFPGGNYTFRLHIEENKFDPNKWYWDYTVNVPKKETTISFKSYETYYEKDGRYMHKFNIRGDNMKGQSITLRIYDYYDSLVYQSTAPVFTGEGGVSFFTWTGHSNGVKNPSGDYTVIASTSGGKTIEKNYYLKILEYARG